jgi:tetratricopeptide (TPR) repeat protein
MSEHELWNELGNLYFMSGAYNQAVYAYHRSIQLDDSFGRPYSNLALAYVQQGKYQEAIELYRSSIELLADNKEKAISWSRLGNVYRHLKDYKNAVVAYQQADELDPQGSAEGQLQNMTDDSLLRPGDIPQSAADASPQAPMDMQPQSAAELQDREDDRDQPASLDPEEQLIETVELTSSNMEVEIDTMPSITDNPVSSSTPDGLADFSPSSPGPVAITFPSVGDRWQETDIESAPDSLDDSTASWALTNLTRYQEDISESPETGSLTTWGGTEHSEDDDWDLYPPLEPDSDVYQPDADGDNLTKWIPLPEEDPDKELKTLELFNDLKKEMLEPDVNHSLINRDTGSVNYLQSSQDDGTQNQPDRRQQRLPDFTEQSSTVRPLALPARSADRSQSKFHHIELDLEERPSADNPSPKMVDFVVADDSREPTLEAQADDVKAEPERQANVRDPQEMEEIEAGIAKFKRAVQVNPKNAYAWDALGTLYKSAGLYKDAILAYQQATSINPPKALYFHNLGLVYACEGRDEDAIGAFQRVVEIDPDYSLAHATLGGYYRKLGLEELAQKHIGKAMKNIYDSENEYNRACLEAICGNTDHAIELLGVALKNKQTYVDWILRDPDLDFIRQDPRFKQLVSDYTR